MIQIFAGIDPKGLETIFQRLGHMNDFSEPLMRMGRIMSAEWDRQFEEQGSPAWKSLSSFTIARKKSQRILEQSGALRLSYAWLAKNVGNPAPGAIFRLTATSLEIGSDVAYAATHQFGAIIQRTVKKKVTIPSRALSGPNKKNIDDMGAAVAAWLDEYMSTGTAFTSIR